MGFSRVREQRYTTQLATVGLYVGVVAFSCQFPAYQFAAQGDGGGGSTPTAGASGSAQAGSAGETGSGGTNDGAAGVAGADQAGAGGVPPDPCGVRPAPLPDSCFDGVQNDSETDIDCGGTDCQPCAVGACTVDTDCLASSCSGSCTAPLRVEYQCGDPNLTIKSPRFQLKLWNEGTESLALSTIELRYYFQRNGVSEPIHAANGQAIWYQGDVPVNVTDDTLWSIARFNADPDDDFDAYLEIGFGVHELQPGDHVDLYQEFVGGNMNGDFDQATHYSFEAAAFPFQDWPKITGYQEGALVWGLEPRRGGDESCFVRAVNVNGAALTVDGNSWEDSAAAGVLVSGSPFSAPPADVFPPVQGTLAQALATGYGLASGDSVSVPVENGSYLVYVYAVSSDGTEAGTLGLEGSAELDEFQAGPLVGAPAWAKLGPYPVAVADGALDVSCLSGALRIAAIELRTPDTAQY